MNDSINENIEFLIIKIVQSGEILKIPLHERNLKKQFRQMYLPLLKDYKLKEKDVFFSNEQGKTMVDFHLNLSVKEIVEKFGQKLKLYYEQIM